MPKTEREPAFRVPHAEIAFLMERLHVSTPDREIVRDLYRRFKRHKPILSRRYRKACYRDAIKQMDGHRKLFKHYHF